MAVAKHGAEVANDECHDICMSHNIHIGSFCWMERSKMFFTFAFQIMSCKCDSKCILLTQLIEHGTQNRWINRMQMRSAKNIMFVVWKINFLNEKWLGWRERWSAGPHMVTYPWVQFYSQISVMGWQADNINGTADGRGGAWARLFFWTHKLDN